MEEKKELSKVILDTCEKELNKTIGFMLTEREADTFSTAILSAGYIKKSEIECDENKIAEILEKENYNWDNQSALDKTKGLSKKEWFAHAIAANLKDIIKERRNYGKRHKRV
jgi:hypothetical protein